MQLFRLAKWVPPFYNSTDGPEMRFHGDCSEMQRRRNWNSASDGEDVEPSTTLLLLPGDDHISKKIRHPNSCHGSCSIVEQLLCAANMEYLSIYAERSLADLLDADEAACMVCHLAADGICNEMRWDGWQDGMGSKTISDLDPYPSSCESRSSVRRTLGLCLLRIVELDQLRVSEYFYDIKSGFLSRLSPLLLACVQLSRNALYVVLCSMRRSWQLIARRVQRGCYLKSNK